jgi:hypothetical protein
MILVVAIVPVVVPVVVSILLAVPAIPILVILSTALALCHSRAASEDNHRGHAGSHPQTFPHNFSSSIYPRVQIPWLTLQELIPVLPPRSSVAIV